MGPVGLGNTQQHLKGLNWQQWALEQKHTFCQLIPGLKISSCNTTALHLPPSVTPPFGGTRRKVEFFGNLWVPIEMKERTFAVLGAVLRNWPLGPTRGPGSPLLHILGFLSTRSFHVLLYVKCLEFLKCLIHCFIKCILFYNVPISGIVNWVNWFPQPLWEGKRMKYLYLKKGWST